MTSIERIHATFLHESTDRTPVFEYVLLPPVADALLGEPHLDYAADWQGFCRQQAHLGWEEALRRYAARRVALGRLLGHDMLYVAPAPTVEDFAPPQEEPMAEATDDDPVEAMVRRNASHEAESAKTDGDGTLIYALLQEEMERQGHPMAILAPCYFHGVWTDIDLLQTMLLAPDVAKEHFAWMTKLALRRLRAYEELAIDVVGIGGDFAGNRPIISKEAYVTYIVPELRKLADAVHASGKFCVNTSDGDLWYVIDAFLCDTGVDGYLEIDSGAGMDLARLKACHPEKTYLGNIDCGEVLSFHTLEDIRKQTMACLEAGGGVGHIFTASNAISASVPLANYMAMVGAYREHCDLPPLQWKGLHHL